MRVIMAVMTLFFLFNVLPVAALNQTHNDTVNLLANRTNMTNTTLFELVTHLENSMSLNETFLPRGEINFSVFVNRTELNTLGYISNSSLEARLNLISHQIAIVNSSVDNQIVNLIATFKDAAKNESFMMLLDRFNSSISVYDSTVNERLSGIRNKLRDEYPTREELYGNYTFNMTNIAYVNDQAVLKSAYDASNLDKVLMLILFAVAVVVPWKFRKPQAAGGLSIGGRMLSVGAEKLSIEDMANPEYQKRVREYYNLIVKINKLKLEPRLQEKVFERAREGTLTAENMQEMISAIRIEMAISDYDKKRNLPDEDRKVPEGAGKTGRKAPKQKGPE